MPSKGSVSRSLEDSWRWVASVVKAFTPKAAQRSKLAVSQRGSAVTDSLGKSSGNHKNGTRSSSGANLTLFLWREFGFQFFQPIHHNGWLLGLLHNLGRRSNKKESAIRGDVVGPVVGTVLCFK